MRLRLALLLTLFLLPLAPPVSALAPQAPPTPAAHAEASPGTIRTVYTLPPEKLKLALALAHKRLALSVAGTVWSITQLLLLLALGVVARLRNFALHLFRNRWLQALVFVGFLLALTSLLDLPLRLIAHHVSVEYGQSVQHWPSWFADQAKGLGLTLLFAVPIVLLLFRVIRWSPRRWWLWFWLPALALSIFGVFIAPIFIDPLFNKFQPLQQTDPALVQRLEQVVHRAGIVIPPDRMFLMQASAKVTGLNAYVTGLGASKRVVVWDTTLARATPDDIAFIFAHEMGHYVLNHIYLGLAFTAFLMLLFFWLGFHGVHWLLARYGPDWGITSQNDWGALVVLLLVVSVLGVLAEPVANGFSRWEEHAADVYGQEAIHGIVSNPQATATESFQVLGEQSLDEPDPNPFVELWSYSHPSISHRVAFAAHYDPWPSNPAPHPGPRYFNR